MGSIQKTNDTRTLAENFGGLMMHSADELRRIMPPTMDLERLKEIMVYNLKLTPKLLECTPQSLMKAVFTLASMGLEPHPTLGEVYVIPYGKEATVQIGYKGFVRLAMNSGEIKSIMCEAVHENDFFDYELGTSPYIKHRPDFLHTESDRGRAIAYYCVVSFNNGSTKFEIMSFDQIEKIRKSSKAGAGVPWRDHYDEMAKKTVFRRAFKWLPKAINRQFTQAVQIDNAAYNGNVIEIEATEKGLEIWEQAPEGEKQQDESQRLNELMVPTIADESKQEGLGLQTAGPIG